MKLQEIIKEKIIDFGGIDKFREECKILKLRLTDKRERELIDSVMMYYRLLFSVNIDIEADTINNPEGMEELKVLFEREAEHNEFAKFYLSVNQYKSKYVKGLRRIAS